MRNRFLIAIFIVILCAILFLANLVVYEGFTHIFSITESGQRALLGIMLGVFSASFIASTILGNWFYNWCTRLYYTVSAVWMGFFIYLFFACGIYAIFVFLFQEPLQGFGILLMACAVITTVYGIFHARRVQVVHLKMKLPNLPPVWQGRKIVWISDLHLGQIHGPKFAEKITKKIQVLSPDIVCVGGDLFDGTSAPDLAKLIAPLSKLAPKIKTYFITGNHEEFGSSEKFVSAVKSLPMVVLMDKMTDVDGLQLVGVDYKNNSKKEKFEEILQNLHIDRQKPSILLKHEPKDLDVAEKAGISLQISGHTHRGQQWPFSLVAKLAYKGYEYGLKPFKNMQVYTSSGVGTWGPPIRVGTNSEIVLLEF